MSRSLSLIENKREPEGKSPANGEETMPLEKLEDMLTAELEKDAEDIDAEYVERLVAQIDEAQRALDETDAQPELPKRYRPVWFKGVAAAVAALVLLFAVAMPMHRAGAWKLADFARFFTPFMEQLGISINNKLTDDEMDIKDLDEGELVPVRITSEKDLPDELYGFPVKPAYLPDGYAFKQAKMLINERECTLAVTYANDVPGEEIFVQLYLYWDAGISMWLVEQEDSCIDMSNIAITTDHEMTKVICEHEIGYYLVWSAIEEDEIVKILRSYELED